MENLKTQFGISESADFGNNTWTFEFPNGLTVSAGEFAILHKDEYDGVINALKMYHECCSKLRMPYESELRECNINAEQFLQDGKAKRN